MLDQDGEVGTFRFVLLDSDSQRPVGLVSRERTEQVLPQNLFGGLWTCESDDDWTYFVNTEGQSTEPDYRWAENVKSAIRL